MTKDLEQFIGKLKTWTANEESKGLCLNLNMVIIRNLDLDMIQDSGPYVAEGRAATPYSVRSVLKECSGVKGMIILNTD